MGASLVLDEITGSVTRLVRQTPTWCAGRMRCGRKDVSFSVKAYCAVGDTVTIHGEWQDDPKWGRQFKGATLTRCLPLDPAGLLRWLDFNVVGVGPARAKLLVDRYGVGLMDACGSNPDEVAAHASIDVSEVRHMAAVWQSTKDEIATLTWLLGQGMSQKQAEDVYEEYGSGAVSLIQDDPYTLLGRVAGFGWETTDALAERLNVVGADPRRMRGGLTACVHKARSAGCTCENVAAAVTGAMTLTATADRALMVEALDAAVRDKMVVRFGDGTDVSDFLATPWSMRCESAAWRALLRAADRSPWLADDDDPLATAARFRDLGGLTLDDTQVAAVANALRYRISVVTGGAGSGKTQLSKAIVNAFEDLGIPIYLAAPTGKAARRMTEVIGRPAKTIHRLLKFNGGTGQYGIDETCPLDHCLILVDEASMLDSEVAYRLFSAVGRRASLVLVGDPNQLPPVGPGSLLRDVLDHALAPTTRLDTVHRQAGALKENSIAILEGRVEPNVPMTAGAAPPWVVHQGVDTPDKARAVVASVYREQLAKWQYEDLKDVQFMTAKHKGPFGTEYLNLYLQHLHQTRLGKPLPEPTVESAAEGKPKLYVDDRVIQVKNDYDLDVMNGEVGTVLSGPIARPRLLGLLGLTAGQRHDAPGSHLLAPIMTEEDGRRTICPTCLTPVELPDEGGWLPRRCGSCGVDYVATDGGDEPDDLPPTFTLTADTPGATRALARRIVKNDTEPVADYVVRFPDRTVVYPAGTANDLHLAYCLSVHKMQGSQVPCAIVLVPKSHWFCQHRGWFYTAVTRAQKTAVILGDPEGIRRAADRTDANLRKTILAVFATCEEARP